MLRNDQYLQISILAQNIFFVISNGIHDSEIQQKQQSSKGRGKIPVWPIRSETWN